MKMIIKNTTKFLLKLFLCYLEFSTDCAYMYCNRARINC
jgi:hypothetical protein